MQVKTRIDRDQSAVIGDSDRWINSKSSAFFLAFRKQEN